MYFPCLYLFLSCACSGGDGRVAGLRGAANVRAPGTSSLKQARLFLEGGRLVGTAKGGLTERKRQVEKASGKGKPGRRKPKGIYFIRKVVGIAVAYVPNHLADVFISYCHEDDFAWIERFKQDLESTLVRKLKARTKPEVFFDAHKLRAGRVFDADIPSCLTETGFFVAMVSPRYNSSTYCRHKELALFLDSHPPESGRLIQLQLDSSTMLPVTGPLAVVFADARGVFPPDTDEYRRALGRVYEPIVSGLDNLYAHSKMVFLAWSSDPQLQEERRRLESEIEGRGLRVFPQVVASYESNVRLRDALESCTTSVHFFSDTPDPFTIRQWDTATGLNRACIIASRNQTEARRGPAGSPVPIPLDQGNPTINIAKAIEQIAGIGRRDERTAQQSLGKTPVFLVFEPDSDATLGIRIRKRIISRGPFEVIVPPNKASTRYGDIGRVRAAVLCRLKARSDWLKAECEALNSAVVASRVFDLKRALLLPGSDEVASTDGQDWDDILRSESDLDDFLTQLQGAAA